MCHMWSCGFLQSGGGRGERGVWTCLVANICLCFPPGPSFQRAVCMSHCGIHISCRLETHCSQRDDVKAAVMSCLRESERWHYVTRFYEEHLNTETSAQSNNGCVQTTLWCFTLIHYTRLHNLDQVEPTPFKINRFKSWFNNYGWFMTPRFKLKSFLF